MRPLNSLLRFLCAAALLVSVGLFLHARSGPEHLPPRKEIAELPKQIGDWKGQDVDIPANFLDTLGPGDFLSRVYYNLRGRPPIDLFLAYFPSQRTGDTIHSPKNCIPGAGWTPLEATRMALARPGGSGITVNRYIIGKGLDRLVVLYWYQAHGRAVASEYWAKFYLVADAIRMNRTDGGLIRVITPVASGESLASAQNRAVEFAQQVLPSLHTYIPE